MTPQKKEPKKTTIPEWLKTLGLSKPVMLSILAISGYGATQIREVIVKPVVQKSVEEVEAKVDSSMTKLEEDLAKSMTRGFYRMEKAMIKVNPKYDKAFNEVDETYSKEIEEKKRLNKMLRGE